MGDIIEDLTSFIEGDGLEQFKTKMADKLRMDAPSKSGKSKSAITVSPDGITLPAALWRVDKGRSITDPSGVKLPKASAGAGFIDEVLANDLDIWSEIIISWAKDRADVSDVSGG
jgi:hypothetical protein|tara:strand:- start:347 stop:691 length:345 start_codon:yes stop_codon:yes gene_type:complete|eukprot:GHVR01094160.1.p1 GENE.GHVR01094160.1~~GHVR01094160.1.p1  ORF type:complete len:115 (+),score=17.61 GHVR01094160.1:86-430(+)